MVTKLVILLAALCVLNGCVSVESLARLLPGATEADATRMAGRKPEFVWDNPDGTRTLEYSSQPLDGVVTWTVTVDASGKVLGTQQILVDPRTTRIEQGMSREHVRRLLGTPRSIVNFRFSGEEVWDWNTINNDGSSYLIRFNAHFREGRLVRTSTRIIDRNDCNMLLPC